MGFRFGTSEENRRLDPKQIFQPPAEFGGDMLQRVSQPWQEKLLQMERESGRNAAQAVERQGQQRADTVTGAVEGFYKGKERSEASKSRAEESQIRQQQLKSNEQKMAMEEEFGRQERQAGLDTQKGTQRLQAAQAEGAEIDTEGQRKDQAFLDQEVRPGVTRRQARAELQEKVALAEAEGKGYQAKLYGKELAAFDTKLGLESEAQKAQVRAANLGLDEQERLTRVQAAKNNLRMLDLTNPGQFEQAETLMQQMVSMGARPEDFAEAAIGIKSEKAAAKFNEMARNQMDPGYNDMTNRLIETSRKAESMHKLLTNLEKAEPSNLGSFFDKPETKDTINKAYVTLKNLGKDEQAEALVEMFSVKEGLWRRPTVFKARLDALKQDFIEDLEAEAQFNPRATPILQRMMNLTSIKPESRQNPFVVPPMQQPMQGQPIPINAPMGAPPMGPGSGGFAPQPGGFTTDPRQANPYQQAPMPPQSAPPPLLPSFKLRQTSAGQPPVPKKGGRG